MGYLVEKSRKKESLSGSRESLELEKLNSLYKPESEFSWKTASPAEIHQNTIPSQREKYKKMMKKFNV